MQKILMCSPDHYDVTYSINPWMDPKLSVDKKLARKQWKNLKSLIENFLELKVEVINQKQELPDMVFTADQGILIDKTFIPSNFCYRERRREIKFYISWFKKRGYNIIRLPKKFKFEGGDFILWGDKILAGFGFRTDKKAHNKIASLTQREVISLKLIDPFLYHLDLAIFPLDEKSLIYYPGAFSKKSRQIIEKKARFSLKASRKDAFNFILNSIVYGKKIITNKGINGLLPDLIVKGFRTAEADISEFKKSGGGVHCLTCVT